MARKQCRLYSIRCPDVVFLMGSKLLLGQAVSQVVTQLWSMARDSSFTVSCQEVFLF
jgi:hypothetical protein